MVRGKRAESPVEAPEKEELTEEQKQALFFQHRRSYDAALATKKKADAEFKNVCKLAKSELGKNAVRDIKVAIALDDENGDEALRDEISAKLRVARWVGSSVGTQFEMFGNDDTPAAERAYAEGKRVGMKGEPAKPPHHPSTEQYREWMRGHGDGNAVLAQGFKRKATAADDGTIGTEEASFSIQ